MTQSDRMNYPPRPSLALAVMILVLPAVATAQAAEEDFQVWTDHPRLLLNRHRLRLLKRERERDSIRWQQFHTLMAGGAQMAEPGFAAALYYQISGDAAFAKKAIEWTARGTDLRQLALAYDWCRDRMTGAQARALVDKIRRGVEQSSKSANLPAVRSRALALIAISEDAPELSQRELKRLVVEWWRAGVAPGLKDGSRTIPHEQMYALFELLHALRDNLQIDLREAAPKYFTQLAAWHLLSHYPATFPAAENEYRIPAFAGDGQPDLDQAALARAAQLAMVAYDTNAREVQYVQGWIMHDRFLLRGTFGIVYEFLWANPYQPGLSYYHLPLVYHDARSGHLFVRSSWEDNATWFGLFDKQMQIFEDGRIQVLNAKDNRKPLTLGDVTIVFSPNFSQSLQPSGRFFVVGLKPRTTYDVEVNVEETSQMQTGASGVLEFAFPPDSAADVHIHSH